MVEGAEMRLFDFERADEVKIELHPNRDTLVYFPDGIIGDTEWTANGVKVRAPSLRRETIAFSPAFEGIRLRTRGARCGARVLLLFVGASLLNCTRTIEIGEFDLRRRVDIESREVAAILQRICGELKCPGPFAELYLRALAMLAVVEMKRGIQKLQRSVASDKGGLPTWRLRRALEMLEDGVSATPRLGEIASSLGLHRSSFCRAFKRSTGFTPLRYLLVCRVNRAKEMMRNSDLTLTEIAFDCGFSSSSQFSVAFRRTEGISPREFRRSIGAMTSICTDELGASGRVGLDFHARVDAIGEGSGAVNSRVRVEDIGPS